jgi:hypothetical protein
MGYVSPKEKVAPFGALQVAPFGALRVAPFGAIQVALFSALYVNRGTQPFSDKAHGFAAFDFSVKQLQ